MVARFAILFLLSAAPRLFAEEPASDAARNRVKVFETWGDEWFRSGSQGDPVYYRLQSRRCTTCDENDWVLTYEQFLPISTTILIDRNTLHLSDVADLTLRKAVESVVLGPYSTSVRLSYGEGSIRSEVELNIDHREYMREEFAKRNTWEASIKERLSHPRSVFKTAELMALSGIKEESLTYLVDRKPVSVKLVYVEDADLRYEDRDIKTHCYEASSPGQPPARLWVSSELGLIQFGTDLADPVRRVASAEASAELATIAEKAEAHRKKMEEERPEPAKRDPAGKILIEMKCEKEGVQVETIVNGRAVAQEAGLTEILGAEIETIRKSGQEGWVEIDADVHVPWQDVIEVMDLCKKHNVKNVELAPPKPQKK